MKQSPCRAIFCAILFAVGAYPQASTGNIRGRITDPSGAVVPKGSVTARHIDTNTTRKTVTNSEGIFDAENLQPGEYDVTVESPGFKSASARVTVLTGNT